MFIPIITLLIHRFGEELANDFLSWFELIVLVWVIGSGICVFKQKVHNQYLDGVIDKMHVLITN
jgi:hypothetical protein